MEDVMFYILSILTIAVTFIFHGASWALWFGTIYTVLWERKDPHPISDMLMILAASFLLATSLFMLAEILA